MLRNLAAVELFVDLGADVNLKCHGTPPLHLAVAAAALPAPGARAFGAAAAAALLHASYDLSAKVLYAYFICYRLVSTSYI
jgi:hypothetical protein